jgi:predicted small secreted protein
MMQRLVPILVLAAALLAGGCTTVKPWERDLHARADMQPSTLDAAIDDHIYFSKEASSGGRGFGGGGCGCN